MINPRNIIGSKIDTGQYWTESWGVTTGCSRVDDQGQCGGRYECWAASMARRFNKSFEPAERPEVLRRKLRRKPSIYFVSLGGDLFDPAISPEFIERVFQRIAEHPQHVFLLLSKQHRRIENLLFDADVPKNICLGITVEDQNAYDERWGSLATIALGRKFMTWISYGPALGGLLPTPFPYKGRMPDWVVAEAASGRDARKPDLDWFRDLRDWCGRTSIPFWLKRPLELDGRRHQEMPRLT